MSMTDGERLLLIISLITGSVGLVAGTLTILAKLEEEQKEEDYLLAYPATGDGPTTGPITPELLQIEEEASRFFKSGGKFGTIDQGF